MPKNMALSKSELIPWNSIGESVVEAEERRLPFQEALASPCATCQTSPCCTHLPLHSFRITNLIELDHALYVLNFDRIELGLAANGEWSIYYVYPCRYLDLDHFTCTVHEQPAQPRICGHYNPYHCWYKRVFTKSVSDEFLQIDLNRMEYIVSKIVFDEDRNIVEVPNWEILVQELAQIPPEPFSKNGVTPASDLLAVPVLAEWQELAVQHPNGEPVKTEGKSYDALQDPCTGCQAYCCKTLTFPQSQPGNASNLDYYQFCLGFPGIELGITDDSWSLVVRTTCRHLVDNRCSIFNEPKRPLICRYYDAWKCNYIVNFGQTRPPGYVRVNLEQFDALLEGFQFDNNGQVTQIPSTEWIRHNVEEKWRSVVQSAPALIPEPNP